MAQLNSRGVHVFEKDKRQNKWYLKSVHPIQWFVNADSRIAIQHGTVFTAAGETIKPKDYPTWLLDQIAAMTDAHLASLGFKRPETRKAA